MKNAVQLAEIEKIRELGVDYVVFHNHLGLELRVRPGERFLDLAPWIESYRETMGSPVYQDAETVAFQVK